MSGDVSSLVEVRAPAPTTHDASFDALVEDIRRRYGSNLPFLFPRIEDQVRRWLGVAPLSTRAAALAGSVGVVVRLGLALLATALVGQWTEIPWSRWGVILAFYALFEATQSWRTPPLDIPPGPIVGKIMEDWTALLPTIVRESDLRDLADFTRRWYTLPRAAMGGLATAAAMLLASSLLAPDAFGDLPVGTMVLLAFLLYDLGAVMVYGSFFGGAFLAREARYQHSLFWPSPIDSPQVQKAMLTETRMGFATGMWITAYLVLVVVLVSWDSALVLPLAAGFLLLGYVLTVAEALSARSSIKRIVEDSRGRRLALLRERIDGFESQFADLPTQQADRLRDLIDLHNMIRDAPSAPTSTHTVMHTLVGLIIPTIMFLITVFGEVYAERVLDTILP